MTATPRPALRRSASALRAHLRRLVWPSLDEAMGRSRDARLVSAALFRAVMGREPGTDEHAALAARAAAGADVAEVLAELFERDEALERSIDRALPALRTRLRRDYLAAGGPGDTDLPAPRLVFLHTMKVGGTSLSDLFTRWAGPERSRVHLLLDDIAVTPVPQLARLRLIAGHIPYEALSLLPGRFSTVLVVREPFARTLSHFSELRRARARYGELTLDEFTSSEVYDVPSGNYQARQLAHEVGLAGAWVDYWPPARYRAVAGDPADEWPLQSWFDSTPNFLGDEELLAKASANLGRIDFAGVTEDLDGVARRVAALFGTDFTPVPHLHVSKPFDRSQLTDAVRRRIEARTEVDRQIYDQVRRRAADGR